MVPHGPVCLPRQAEREMQALGDYYLVQVLCTHQSTKRVCTHAPDPDGERIIHCASGQRKGLAWVAGSLPSPLG